MPARIPDDARARFVAVAGREQTRRDESAPHPQENGGLWGSLVPCNTDLPQYDLRKGCPEYRIGSASESDVAGIKLPGLDPSAVNCVLHWDGDESSKSAVKVTDFSPGRGTFINGMRIGLGRHRVLRDGNELSFGDSRYRFVYRHKACNAPDRNVNQVYDVHRVLGSGTFGTVTKALHKRKGVWYAIKTISTTRISTWTQEIRDGGPQSEEAQKVMREIAVLAHLTHPNICELRESFIDEDSIHLVLEFVPGGHLGTLIRKRSFDDEPFKEEETQRISYQICQALAYMHGRQIAHRDLKPENILLCKDNPPVIKVADFGLAKAFSSASKLLSECGTPKYMAPEVLSSDGGGYNETVDSWSLGIVILVVLGLGRRSPYVNDDKRKGHRSRLEERMVDWGLLTSAGLSHEGEHFVRQLLERDPRWRMTLTKACDHSWLSLCAAAEEDRGRPRLSGTPGPAALPVDPGTSGPNCKTRSTGPAHGQCPLRRPSSVGIQPDAPVTPAQGGHMCVGPPPRGTKRKVAHRSSATLARTPGVGEYVDDAEVSSSLDNKQPEGGRRAEKARPAKRARTIRQKVPSDEVPGPRPVRRSRRLNPRMGRAP